MIVYFENVKIQLTKEQIDLVEKARRKRQRCYNSFSNMLKNFGFTPSNGNNDCFEHENGWWAEIITEGNSSRCWITGKGLKSSSSFPGGWMYWEPKEIEKEILKYYESINQ